MYMFIWICFIIEINMRKIQKLIIPPNFEYFNTGFLNLKSDIQKIRNIENNR